MISFVLVIVSTVAISCAGFFVANAVGLQNANQLAGMTCGLYIGGTPNLIAIGNALLSSDNKASVIAAANTSDFFVGGVYFLLILTVIRPVYKKILGSKKVKPIITEELPANETDGDAITADGEATEIKTETQTEYDYKSIPRDKNLSAS